jgi:CheY-like chemotaxis protein
MHSSLNGLPDDQAVKRIFMCKFGQFMGARSLVGAYLKNIHIHFFCRFGPEHGEEIHLLMTDVVMPEMNGHDLASQIREVRPKLRCLFMSGYTADIIAKRGMLEKGVRFIQKPFTLKDMAVKVRKVLESDR